MTSLQSRQKNRIIKLIQRTNLKSKLQPQSVEDDLYGDGGKKSLIMDKRNLLGPEHMRKAKSVIRGKDGMVLM